MASNPIVAPVAWQLAYDGDRDVLECTCRDAISQRDYRFEIPAHLLPSLAYGLDDLIAAHPELFPAVVQYRFK